MKKFAILIIIIGLLSLTSCGPKPTSEDYLNHYGELILETIPVVTSAERSYKSTAENNFILYRAKWDSVPSMFITSGSMDTKFLIKYIEKKYPKAVILKYDNGIFMLLGDFEER